MKIVGTDAGEVERALLAGELSCPDCAGQLRPWGSARWRDARGWAQVQRRRPRRSRCARCQTTHVLISTDSLLRRRDLAEAIGAALTAKAAGHGYRKAAAAAGAPESTTRRWLRRFADMAEAIRVWFTVLAHDLDPLLAPILARPTACQRPPRSSHWRPRAAPHGRPRKVPADGHVGGAPGTATRTPRGGRRSARWSVQRHHPLAGHGVGQAHRLAVGDDGMSVVHEAVNQRRGDGLVHQLVEAGGVQVRRQGE